MRLIVQHFLLPTLFISCISATTNPLKLQRRREKLNFRKNRDLEIAEKTTQRQNFLKTFQQKKVETLIQKAGLYEHGSRCLPELDFTYSAAEFEASEQILNSFVDNGAFSSIKGFKGNLFFTKIPEKFQKRDFYLVAYGGLGDKKNLFRVTTEGVVSEEQVGITVEHAKFKKYKNKAFKLSFDDGVWFDDGELSLEIAHFAESDGSFINWYYCYKERDMVVDGFRSVVEVSKAQVELMTSRPTTARPTTAKTTTVESTTAESTTAWFENTKKVETVRTTTAPATTESTTTKPSSTEKVTTKPATTPKLTTKPTTTESTTESTTTISTTTEPTTTISTVPIYGTPSTADIVFVVEGSASVGEENFRKTMDFIQKLSDKLIIAPGRDRIALITYSDSVVANFYFIDKKRKLNRLLSKTQFPGGTGAYPGATMLLAKRYIFDSFGREDGTRKFMFHIPHSVSSDTLDELYAEQIRTIDEIEIVTIGVADEDYGKLKGELHDLHKGREGSVFMTRSFEKLNGYVDYLADIVRGRLRV